MGLKFDELCYFNLTVFANYKNISYTCNSVLILQNFFSQPDLLADLPNYIGISESERLTLNRLCLLCKSFGPYPINLIIKNLLTSDMNSKQEQTA